MKWYIGQDVVCIKTHRQGIIKEGNVFTIIGLRQTCCSIQINIGISSRYGNDICTKCSKISKNLDGVWWFGEDRFVPLESITDISEIEAILNEPAYN